MGKLLSLFIAALGVLVVMCWGEGAYAQGKYFNVSVEGSYQRNYSQYSTFARTVLGGEVGVPFSDFLEVSVGHNLRTDKTVYTEEYRQRIIEKYGASNLPDVIEQEESRADTTVNLGIGYPILMMRPSLFAGKMWRRVCTEDTFEDHGCTPENNTWNAGASLSIYVTQALRFRLSYRVSPSTREDSKKTLDDQVTIGLTWGI